MTPEQALKHCWITRSRVQAMLKENQSQATNSLMSDIIDVIKPLPATARERQQAQG